MSKISAYIIAVIVGVSLISAGVILFAQGFRFDFNNKTLEKTGTVLVKSSPDGAKIFVDAKFTAVTNNQVTSLSNGKYHIKLTKEGYFDWEKTVEVKEEYVTEINALLIPQAPTLSPLTTGSVKNPVFSSNRDRIAFLKSGEKSGIYTLNLSGNNFLGLLRSTNPLMLDSDTVKYALAQKIAWAPDDSEMLVEMNPSGYYSLKFNGTASPPEATSSSQYILTSWETIGIEKNRLLAAKIKTPENLAKIATESATPWSPDEKKFLFRRVDGQTTEYWVYDGTEPLGIGNSRENKIFTTTNPDRVRLTWFSTSQHVVITELNEAGNAATISLVEIDGGNKTTVYSGKIASASVFPTPDASRVIILTSFIDGTEPNLYAITLR